ncbi:hypothetical protein [Falsibacillus pallidus]|uniref:Membrane protein YqhR n=1 Tax=Falsibacillus pallidus TaxID=493781 RepID=A0A370GV97_9BACI|nr:hypothetical protein [Falsibacillus pallidus]RDI47602.1 hypothetical protein DFR59_101261 [Falsibacillus pallidus]
MRKSSAAIGTISGVFLGLFLKLAQALTGIHFYTLLLNIDFIPIAGKMDYPEFIEFLIHLLTSILIVWVYLKLLYRFTSSSLNKWLLAFLLIIPAILLYFPLSALAEKPVPTWHDWPAILIWSVGHLLYAALMAALVKNDAA